MLRQSNNICLMCMFKQSPRSIPRKQLPRCQQKRDVSQAQQRLPSRMSLSPRVGQPNPDVAPSGKLVKRRQNSPFGGMNQTEARIRGVSQRPSSMQERRSLGRKTQPDKKKEAKGFKALKMQRSLAPLSYSHRTEIKERIKELETFKNFKLLPSTLR